MGKIDYKEIMKFLTIGVMNTLINLLTLYIQVEFLHIYYIIAAIISFIIAVTNSFIFNTLWTFNSDIKYKLKERYMTFFLISLFSACINIALLYILTEHYHIWYIYSQISAIAISFIINYLGNKFITYKK